MIKHNAFCFDAEEKTWLFILVEDGMDIADAIEQAQDTAE